MERGPSNDNGRGWCPKGPDSDGLVWFVDERPGQECMIALSSRDVSGEAFATWLEEVNYGERP